MPTKGGRKRRNNQTGACAQAQQEADRREIAKLAAEDKQAAAVLAAKEALTPKFELIQPLVQYTCNGYVRDPFWRHFEPVHQRDYPEYKEFNDLLQSKSEFLQEMRRCNPVCKPIDITRGDITLTILFIASADTFKEDAEAFANWLAADQPQCKNWSHFPAHFDQGIVAANNQLEHAWLSLRDRIAWTFDERIARLLVENL